MNLEKYKPVIRMVLAKHAGADPSFVTEELLKSIEIAQSIAGELDVPVQQKRPSPSSVLETGNGDGPNGVVLIETKTPSANRPIVVSAAPPVEGADNEPEDAGDADLWESKFGKGDGCERLSAYLRKILPASITLKLPGFDAPLTLMCGIGSPGIRFVHVSYSLPGDTLGPRVTLMTSQKNIDPQAIVDDITMQAGALYSKEKRVIQPRPSAPPPPPTSQDFEAMLDKERRGQSSVSVEDAEIAKTWSGMRSPRWS